jgi:oxygen-independent coproporphyrinogen-3 oxidase
VLTGAGYTWIGLDHFVLDTDELALAQANGELHCNVIGYTARPHAHVLGFGAGAIGDVDGTAVRNEPSRIAWQQQVAAGRLPVTEARRRTVEDIDANEATVRLLCDLELRLNASRLAAEAVHARLAPFAAQGLVALAEDRVAVTPPGRFALEQICHALQHPGLPTGTRGRS